MSCIENPWETPPASLVLPADEVQVWRISLDQADRIVAGLRDLLTASERSRADRFHFPADRSRFTVGRGTLRTILGRYLNINPSQLVFQFGPNGKPSLGVEADRVAVRFNLTHSRDLALLAVVEAREVGVDVEAVRSMKDVEHLVGRFFSAREVAEFESIADDEKLDAFFRGWTRKEAYMKATGKGFAMPLEKFDVSIAPGTPARLLGVVDQPGEVSRWTYHDLDPGPGFQAALAVEGEGCRVRCYDFQHAE